MSHALRCLTNMLMLAAMGGCSLFDSGTAWQGGPYKLFWIDTDDNTSLCRDLGNGACIGRVEDTVFAVGWDGRYVVAKQHAHGDRALTNYFIVDARDDTDDTDPPRVVTGPLTAAEFQQKSAAMHLPGFSKVLASLE